MPHDCQFEALNTVISIVSVGRLNYSFGHLPLLNEQLTIIIGTGKCAVSGNGQVCARLGLGITHLLLDIP